MSEPELKKPRVTLRTNRLVGSEAAAAAVLQAVEADALGNVVLKGREASRDVDNDVEDRPPVSNKRQSTRDPTPERERPAERERPSDRTAERREREPRVAERSELRTAGKARAAAAELPKVASVQSEEPSKLAPVKLSAATLAGRKAREEAKTVAKADDAPASKPTSLKLLATAPALRRTPAEIMQAAVQAVEEPGGSEHVMVNCSGRNFRTSVGLISSYPSGRLARLLEAVKPTGKSIVVYVDTCPDRFSYIMDWYRYGEIHLPKNIPVASIMQDARSLQLPDEIVINGVVRTAAVGTAHRVAAEVTDAVITKWPTFFGVLPASAARDRGTLQRSGCHIRETATWGGRL